MLVVDDREKWRAKSSKSKMTSIPGGWGQLLALWNTIIPLTITVIQSALLDNRSWWLDITSTSSIERVYGRGLVPKGESAILPTANNKNS